jgi:methyl-accepting chemotaxis protein
MANSPPVRLHYAPILLGVAFIATLFMVAESGYKRIHEAGATISAAEERQALLSRYLRVMLDAESAQRGFLLSEDKRYLRSFDPAIRSLDPLLNSLVEKMHESGFDADAAKLQLLRNTAGQKIGEMRASLRLYGEVNREAALQLLDTDIGQKAMLDLRLQLRELWDAEQGRLAAARAASERDLRTSRVLLGAAAFLSLVLVILIGALLGRDLRSRAQETQVLGRAINAGDALVLAQVDGQNGGGGRDLGRGRHRASSVGRR